VYITEISDSIKQYKMKIAFVSAEVYPFSKVGGLGDVAGVLPVELANQGISVNVITPGYGSIDRKRFPIQRIPYRFTVKIGAEMIECGVSRWVSAEQPKHCVYFVENEFYFGARGIYSDTNGQAYEDNNKRFLLLTKAALEIARMPGERPDIIHCNDNHTAMIPVYLKADPALHHCFQNTKTLLTLHNIAYQGIDSMDHKKWYGLPDDFFQPTGALEWWGQINPLKAGIIFADALSTVSPTHAREIMNSEVLSAGMQNIIRSSGKTVYGILNGVDYQEWLPATDRYIAKPYSIETVEEKEYNKIALLNDMGIDQSVVHKPLIGMVSRLVEQKGIALLIESIDRMMALDIGMIVLGSGEPEYERAVRRFARRYPGRFVVDFGYNNPLAHKIMAGCDMFLMPSRYEPCGITQMAALKYGTVPIVHKTGGLADTVIQWDGQSGNGFVFESYSADDLIKSVRNAVTVFMNRDERRRIMLNGMASDFSWQQSAKQYIELYTNTYTCQV
jgi:starch synthase